MFRYGILVVAAGSLMFAVTHVVNSQVPPPIKTPLVPPPQSPFDETVAGAGIVEGRSNSSGTANISVGSQVSGLVTDVYVKVGQAVPKGTPLFALDARQLKAELLYREANLAAAAAQLERLNLQPREEEKPPALAKLAEAEATLKLQQDLAKRAERMFGTNTIGEEEFTQRRQGLAGAVAQHAQAKANLDLLLAGAWAPDKAVAQAQVALARAQMEQTRTDLDRLVARAPIAGSVIQLNVKGGEFVGTPPNQSLVVLSDIEELHVRVDIDENDIHRFRPDMKAVAKLRGDPSKEFQLAFARVEPYVVPKKSLTGDNTERVDTRVLQTIYKIEPGPTALYVGMQLDVFLKAAK